MAPEQPSLRLPDALPFELTLTAGAWEAAAVIAGLRLASNDPTRTRFRDQGTAGNVRNDVMGVFAELVGRYVLERYVAAGPVHGVLLDTTGSVDEVDASYQTDDGAWHRIELKGHLRQANYTRFAINDEAHRRSMRRKATGYVGVITSPGGPAAVVSAIVPVGAVQDWPVAHLNPERQDPARVMPLTEFRNRYTRGLDVSLDAAPLVGWPRLVRVAGLAREHLADVDAAALAALSGTAVDARDWAVACLRLWR